MPNRLIWRAVGSAERTRSEQRARQVLRQRDKPSWHLFSWRKFQVVLGDEFYFGFLDEDSVGRNGRDRAVDSEDRDLKRVAGFHGAQENTILRVPPGDQVGIGLAHRRRQ